MMFTFSSCAPVLAAALLLTGCARGSGTDASASGADLSDAALEALSSEVPHELFGRLDFWAREAQGATSLWGRAFATCSQQSDHPRPNCAPVLMHATALQSAFLHGFMKELQAQAPGMPPPPPPPPLPGSLEREDAPGTTTTTEGEPR